MISINDLNYQYSVPWQCRLHIRNGIQHILHQQLPMILFQELLGDLPGFIWNGSGNMSQYNKNRNL